MSKIKLENQLINVLVEKIIEDDFFRNEEEIKRFISKLEKKIIDYFDPDYFTPDSESDSDSDSDSESDYFFESDSDSECET